MSIPGGGFNLREQLAQASDLVRAENEGQHPSYEPATDPPPPATSAGESPEPKARARRKQTRRYDQMARIEGRLHLKQLRELTALTLKLRDQRGTPAGERERITNNTLLRVAVAVLLKHQHALVGTTEAELTDSLLTHLSPEDHR